MLDAEDRQVMLEAVGVTAVAGTAGEMLVSPPEYGDPETVYAAGGLETVNPVCQAAREDLERLGVVDGESGTVLTIEGQDYRVLAMRPSSSGFVLLELGQV
ncbi:MAG TPA: hypothetical protein ENI89_13290 [Desulfobulbus sp.]|nr:hypothetical protein [Desulfobulbus sp.]